MSSKQVKLTEVLFEFVRVGRYLRVNAIEPKTGIEVAMIADPKHGETIIKRLAARKLAYVISKKRRPVTVSRKYVRDEGGNRTDEIA